MAFEMQITPPITNGASPPSANDSKANSGASSGAGPSAAPTPEKPKVLGALVEKSLRSENLRLAWEECLGGLTESTPAQRKECMASVAALRSEFMTAFADVPDADDRAALCTVFYVNLKSRWIMLNIWSGYRIAAGKPDELLMGQLGMLSALLDSVEKVMARDDIAVVTEFLSHPIPRPEPRNPLLAALPAPVISLPTLSHHNSRKLREMEETIAGYEAQIASARDKDRHFLEALGTSDSKEIIQRLGEAQNQLLALKDLQELMGDVETTMNLCD